MNQDLARQPWTADPRWIWEEHSRGNMEKIAPLFVTVTSQSTDLTSASKAWFWELSTDKEGFYYWGGFGCQLLQSAPSRLEMELSSSGEDAFESLRHAAQWFFESVVLPHEDVLISWVERPMRSGEGPGL